MRKPKKAKTTQAVAPCKLFVPRTEKQGFLAEALHTHQLVCGVGVAGSGKTYTAGMVAARMLLEKRVEQVILTRPNVPTGKSLGSFPGTVQEKLAPWLAPITNVLKEGLTPDTYEQMENRQIIIQPLETIRGMSFNDAFIIVDEAQNLTLEEIKALSTRIGENSVMALIGDPTQSDIRKGNDLSRFVGMCNNNNIKVPSIEFTVDDVVRSDICGDLIRMFHKEGI